MSVALVLGGAENVWRDVKAVQKRGLNYGGVVCCNEVGVYWPDELDAWVSVHPLFFLQGKSRRWALRRRERGFPDPKTGYWSHQSRGQEELDPFNETPWKMDGMVNFGSSGLFAVKVALIDLGYDSVVLCGVPMTVTPHFDRPKNWRQANGFRKNWIRLDDQIKRRIKSMSGWTKEHFGGPE